MTEEEAKTKWCPFARGQMRAFDTMISVNREVDGHPPYNSLCIASACMAWRWIDATTSQWVPASALGQLHGWVSDGAKNAFGNVKATLPQSARRGCCGLAGQP